MTRIALFLTAIPLAVALAMILNNLLDRRVAALARVVRRPSGSKLRGLLAFVVLTSLVAAPVLAADDVDADCAAIDCSIVADADQVENLWTATSTGVVLVAQSRIPVWVDADAEPAADEADQIVADERRSESSRETPGERPKA